MSRNLDSTPNGANAPPTGLVKSKSAPALGKLQRKEAARRAQARRLKNHKTKKKKYSLKDVWVVVRYTQETGYQACQLVRTRKIAVAETERPFVGGASYSAALTAPITEGDTLAFGKSYYITLRDARGADADWRVASAWTSKEKAQRRAAAPDDAESTVSTSHTYVGGPIPLTKPPAIKAAKKAVKVEPPLLEDV
jgi:hypothetical protein